MVSEEKEEFCTNRICGDFEFKCKQGQCIRDEFRCDNNNDCEDGTDETDCSRGKYLII